MHDTFSFHLILLHLITLKKFVNRREENGACRKLHNDELHNLYSSLNIVRVIKSRRMRWVGHVARMGEGRGVYRVLVGMPECKIPLRRPRRERITLRWTLGSRDRWDELDSAGLG
jgi:hypothetical protein